MSIYSNPTILAKHHEVIEFDIHKMKKYSRTPIIDFRIECYNSISLF